MIQQSTGLGEGLVNNRKPVGVGDTIACKGLSGVGRVEGTAGIHLPFLASCLTTTWYNQQSIICLGGSIFVQGGNNRAMVDTKSKPTGSVVIPIQTWGH